MSLNSAIREKSTEACPICGSDNLVDTSKPEGTTPCPTCGSRTWFDREKSLQIAVINAAGALDIETLQRLADARHAIVLDFSQVRHLSPSVPAQLLAFDKKLKMQNQRLKFIGFQPDTLNLLKLAKMDTVFEIYSNEDDALNSLSG
jgi:anti-anti-sigma regulatory factor